MLRQAVSLELPYGQQKDRLIKRFLRVYLETLLSHTAGNQSFGGQDLGTGAPVFEQARRAAQGRGLAGPRLTASLLNKPASDTPGC